MTEQEVETIKRRIILKKQLIEWSQEEIKELEAKLAEHYHEPAKCWEKQT